MKKILILFAFFGLSSMVITSCCKKEEVPPVAYTCKDSDSKIIWEWSVLKATPVEKWQCLDTLHLSGNQLTTLPPEVREWKNLKRLYLFNNQLTSLPPEVREWKNLEWFHLGNNQLTTLPPEVREWKNLKELGLYGNKFSQTERDKIKAWLPNTKIYW